jgi:hypothetical protein
MDRAVSTVSRGCLGSDTYGDYKAARLAVVDSTPMRTSSVDQRCLRSDMHGDVKVARLSTSGPDSVQASYAYQLPPPHGRAEVILSTASSDRMDRAVSRGASYVYQLPAPHGRT